MQVQELEDAAVNTSKKIIKLSRDVKHWEICQWFRDRIESFKKSMSLISDLRNPAMRQRHWDQLMQTIQTVFDPTTDQFTLNSIVQLRLDLHAEFIAEMSCNATKELAIEQGIAAIADTWKELELDLVCTATPDPCVSPSEVVLAALYYINKPVSISACDSRWPTS
jgi:dynein heavy chain, axonemal